MRMKIFKVIITRFDSLENRQPIYKTSKLFKTKLKAKQYVESIKIREKPYRGYDDEIYPQFSIRSINII